MKKTLLFSVCAALTASLVSCGGPGGKAKTAETADAKTAKNTIDYKPGKTIDRPGSVGRPYKKERSDDQHLFTSVLIAPFAGQ